MGKALLVLALLVAISISGMAIAIAQSSLPLYGLIVSNGELKVVYIPSHSTLAIISPSKATFSVPLYVEGSEVVTEKSLSKALTDLRKWVEANYYSREEIDSWNLIKNYTLLSNLNANGFNIINVGSLGIGVSLPRAPLHVASRAQAMYVIEVYNPNSYNLTNFQIMVNVSAIPYKYFEIVTERGTEVPYCFEHPNGECNESRSDVIWIKVPYVPANGRVTLYVINSSVNKAVNGDKVFDFYDGFDERSLDSSKWVAVDYSLGNGLWLANGTLLIEGGDAKFALRTVQNFSGRFIVEWSMKPVGSVGQDWDTGLAIGASKNRSMVFLVDDLTPWYNLSIVLNYWWSGEYNASKGYRTDVQRFHVYQAIVDTIDGWVVLRDLSDGRVVSYRNISFDFSGHIWVFTDSDSSPPVNTSIDWIRVRKYADSPPIALVEKLPPIVALFEGSINATGFVYASKIFEGGVPLESKYVTYAYLLRNYYNRSEIDRVLESAFSSLRSYVDSHILGNVSSLRSYVDTNIVGNYSSLKSWVEANYYNKSVIDSWNLIKNYTLLSNLNANGHAIAGVGSLTMTGWAFIPSISYLEISSLAGGASYTLARNGTLGAPVIHSGSLWVGNSSRYFKMFFGALNDLEFNGSAMIIHPAWGSSGYNPSGLVYISNDSSYIKVGIGTDNPQYRLDVNGDIRAKGGTVYADYFHFTENGNRTGIYLDYFPQSLPSPSGNGLENAVGLAVNGTPKTFIDVNGYVYAPRFYVTEENQYTSPKYYIDWYPDDTLRVIHYSDGAQPMIIYPFGVATGFSFDKNTLQRIQSFQSYYVGILPSSWGTVVNVTFTGTVLVCIYSGNWNYADQIEIDLDGVTKTFTLSSNPSIASFCLTFVVSNSLVIKVHNSDTTNNLDIYVTLIEVSK